ncbi:MAG: DinB family protein [Ginsengibacter sp.]
MHIIPFLLKELEQEAGTTRKFFKLVTLENFQWKPHEKSMSIIQLTSHIAELPAWIDSAITTDGIDFGKTPYKSPDVHNTADLIKLLDDSIKKATDALLSVRNEDDLLQTWTIRNNDQIIAAMTKFESVRIAYSQTTHHRAQLGVYLRLLNIPVPQSYGPTADEPF